MLSRMEFHPPFNNTQRWLWRHTEGLPLTLEVMGKYLKGKGKLIWEQATEALIMADDVVGFDEKLWAKLKVSYDGLDREEQDMFLDATTVFKGQHLEEGMAVWSITAKGRQDMRWQHLLDLSLVWELPSDTSSVRKQIGMHEQLLSLGRKISLTPGNRGYRIWEKSAKEIVLEQLSADNNFLDDFKVIFSLVLHTSDVNIPEDCHKDIVALNLDYSDLDIAECFNEGMRSILGKRIRNLLGTLCKPRRLRYLWLTGINIDQSPLPTSLLFLALDDLAFSILPFNPSDHKLMATLYLIRCDGLLTLPATFGQLSALRSLHLQCQKLKSLPASFGQLSSLRDLWIECLNLKSLPESFGHLAKLQNLVLFCQSLKQLPETVGNLKALELLWLTQCNVLAHLSESFGHLSMLKTLRINCRALRQLPQTFGNLKALEELVLECDVLTHLPNSFGHLSRLKTLRINCRALRQLPGSFGNLKALELLWLVECNVLTHLPDWLGHLSRLETLRINCRALRQLPESFGNLKALEGLELVQCNVLTDFPDSFGQLAMLETLDINCTALTQLPETFGTLKALEDFQFLECHVLTHLPDSFGHLAKLKNLTMYRTALEKLPETFGNLKALQVLELDGCNFLTGLPDSFGNLRRHKTLRIFVCSLLQELPDTFLHLQGLEHIHLLWTFLGSIPNFENLRSLTTLRLHWHLEARFPTLPKCLGEVITENNYNRSPFDFNVVDRQFTIKPVGDLPLPRRGRKGGRQKLNEVIPDMQTRYLKGVVGYWQRITRERRERADCGSTECEPQEGEGEERLIEAGRGADEGQGS